MSKIGEGGESPNVPTLGTYHKQLEKNALKFEDALETYAQSVDDVEKVRLKAVMSQHMELIQQAVNELKVKGLEKQGEKVASDYKKFVANGSEENFSALEHDMQTLRDYNKISSQEPKLK